MPEGALQAASAGPLDWQLDLYEWVVNPHDPRRFCAIMGGIGCGKTHALANVAGLVGASRPGSSSILVSDCYPSLEGNNQPELRDALEGLAEWRDKSRRWLFPGNASLELRHYELPENRAESKNPLEGRTITGVGMVDEAQAIRPTVLGHLTGRCRGSSHDLNGQRFAPKIIINGRPDAGSRWWARAAEADPANWLLLRPRTADNPHNGVEYLSNLARIYDAAMLRCLTEGTEAPVTGAAFGVFREAAWPAGNVLHGFRFSAHDPVWLGVDFGRRFPAVVWVQTVNIAGHPVDVVFDEVAVDEVLTPQLVTAIRAPWRHRWPGYSDLYGAEQGAWHISRVYADPAGNARQAHSGQSDVAILRRPVNFTGGDGLGGGLGAQVVTTTDPDRTPVHAGVTRLRGLMDPDQGHRSLAITAELWGRDERLQVPEKQRTLRRAILGFRLEDIDAKARGKKESPHTHHIDALRYWGIGHRGGSGPVSLPQVSHSAPRAPRTGAQRSPVGGAR